MVYFTNWVPDKEVQYMYGWIMDGFIILNLLVNISVIFYFAYTKLKLLFIKTYRKLNKLWDSYFVSDYLSHGL